MRNFIKAFSIYAICLLLIFGFFLFPVFSVFASPSVYWLSEETLTSPAYSTVSDGIFDSDVPYSGSLFAASSSGPAVSLVYPNVPIVLQPGTYVVSGVPVPSTITGSIPPLSGVARTQIVDGSPVVEIFDFGQPFTVTVDTIGIVVQSYNESPVIQEYVEPLPPLYSSAWDLLKYHIYGDMELTPEMNLTLTLFATLIAVAVVVLPFVIIWLIIRFVSSLLR